MKKVFFILFFATQFIFANNLNITNVTKINDNQLAFDVSWDNSWLASNYKDATWIFIKYKNSSRWHHLNITSITTNDFSFETYSDKKGIMLSRITAGTGSVSGTITVDFNSTTLGGPFPDFKVFGVEMVHINQGSFWLGDGISTGTFYQYDDGIVNGESTPLFIPNENEIKQGETSYDGFGIGGDAVIGNIPANFPKGFNSFYVMKYEITNEQFVAFLNTLTPIQQQTHTFTDLSAITSSNRFVFRSASSPYKRNAIACNANAVNTSPITFYCDLNNNSIPNETNDGQNIAAALLGSNQSIAYLDWAALRPISILEYEKMARGTSYPIAGELPNGSALSITPIGSISNSGKINETFNNIETDGLMSVNTTFGAVRVGSMANATTNRLQSGASHYGIMNLCGNLEEYVITITSTNNLSYFTDKYGDGSLDSNGYQNSFNIDKYARKGASYYNNPSNSTYNYDRIRISDNKNYNIPFANSNGAGGDRGAFRGAR